LVPIAGASDREGRSRRNLHHWIAPSRGMFIPIFLFLIIAAHRGFNIVPFSGSLQYGNATRLQSDDGSDRGPARGLLRWAEVSVGSGDRRRRATRARAGPSLTSFGFLGPDNGTSIDSGQATRADGAAAARVVEVVSAVRATHPLSILTHARALATRTGVASTAAREAGAWKPRLSNTSGSIVRRQGDVNYRGADCACAVRLIPACSLIGFTGCGRRLDTTEGLVALAQPG
jgi:hypothetical protein